MNYIADLHIHSKHSMATSKHMDLEHLYLSAQAKGITVVGTGDFTHPQWFSEIVDKLVPAEPGLYQLKPDIAASLDSQVAASCRGTVRFILQCEISSVYKKNGKTRKNHHIIFFPNTESAARFNLRLDAIGNIKSDGRPILGLDSRDLLEIVLEISEHGFLIPAHIWTPWFSLLGSRSGFDTIAECFEDLSSHIFAAETGLSSDPPMNWRVSQLDRLTLVSNSDAHSPANLGRNANRFDTELSYFALKHALKTKDPQLCLGTLDMYPEEGKYHYDGHRKCQVCLQPSRTRELDGICPECGKPLTIGVLYRVEQLADRPEGFRPQGSPGHVYQIPLAEIISEILEVGPQSKKVQTHLHQTIKALGPELKILHDLPLDMISRAGVPLLDKAIERMRNGQVLIRPGYDGEYGRITLFEKDEKKHLMGQQSLFSVSDVKDSRTSAPTPRNSKPSGSTESIKGAKISRQSKIKVVPVSPESGLSVASGSDILDGLNPDQQEAVCHERTPLLIVAGPGTGKTRTLTHKIAYLIRHRNINPEHILAITFTHKAALEMRHRIKALLGDFQPAPQIATFHSLCLHLLKQSPWAPKALVDDTQQALYVTEAVGMAKKMGIDVSQSVDGLTRFIQLAKQQMMPPDNVPETIRGQKVPEHFPRIYQLYQQLLASECLMDFEDLIGVVVRQMETEGPFRRHVRDRFVHVLVDEYQDLNLAQYHLIRCISPSGTNLTAIGDPNQAIYGFRGSDVRFFTRFVKDYPDARVLHLSRNYRSTETILSASHQIIENHNLMAQTSTGSIRIYSGIQGPETLGILESSTERSEAVTIGRIIENMVGGIGFHSMDFNKTLPHSSDGNTDRSFSDFAILYRTRAQGSLIAQVLEKAGIPVRLANKQDLLTTKGIAHLIGFLKYIQGTATYSDFQTLAEINGSGLGRVSVQRFCQWGQSREMTVSQALDQLQAGNGNGLPAAVLRKIRQFHQRLISPMGNQNQMTVQQLLSAIVGHPLMASVVQDLKTGDTRYALKWIHHMAGQFHHDVDGFLENLQLLTDADLVDFRSDAVSLMTIHTAKGLEFPVVFITGCEDGLIPYETKAPDPESREEERRLFYVAMTRAMDTLYLSYAKKRRIHGKLQPQTLSPFVMEIEQRLLTKEATARKSRKKAPVQLDLFDE